MAELERDGATRRQVLKCMTWAGTGVVWTVAGGVPRSQLLGSQLLGTSEAQAQVASGFSFVQISDSHIGFRGGANANPTATLQEAIDRIGAQPKQPAFLVHTGDITHLSRPEQFDAAEQAVAKAGLDTFYVPGEHDFLDAVPGTAYMDRHGRRLGAVGAGWYAFDYNDVHFVGLVNITGAKPGSLGALGPVQLAWLAADLNGRSSSTPIVLLAHVPLWTVAETWGWGTEDATQALGLLKRFGSVTILNGHVHQVMQKIEGAVTFHTARSTAFPQPLPGTAPQPGPVRVPDNALRGVLGITDVVVKRGTRPLAVTDSALDET